MRLHPAVQAAFSDNSNDCAECDRVRQRSIERREDARARLVEIICKLPDDVRGRALALLDEVSP